MKKKENDQNVLDDSATLWSNKDNAEYYEKVPVAMFQQYAVIGGFDDCCDIEIIYNDYIKKASSVIEVGAGYGRVIKNLLDRGYTGKLTAIERSFNFCTHLKKEFTEKVDIVCCSIEDFVCENNFDVVLWMWSNISEWPKEAQKKMIGKLASFCSSNGIIIIETISHLAIPLNVTSYETQTYTAETEYGNVYGYVPSIDEVESYAKENGLVFVSCIPYMTKTGRSRFISILRK